MANIRRMEIEPADNGFTLTTTHDPEGNKPYDYDANREKTVHPSVEDLVAHVHKKLKTHKHKKMNLSNHAALAVKAGKN